MKSLLCDWTASAATDEPKIHQVAPYIGKLKSPIAASLIRQFTDAGDTVFDPFAGSGSIALEAWLAKRHVIANDLSPYATLLTRAKLTPYRTINAALLDLEKMRQLVAKTEKRVDLRSVPTWVRSFFHPRTLRETIAWTTVLREQNRDFLLACLLGILHHQRPGFLSYPSSHTVPYLRLKLFPKHRFPELYAYRSIVDRLEAKVRRALSNLPPVDFSIRRRVVSKDAATYAPPCARAIITSPPYMRQLDYARDNRLRLWFLGCADWELLDSRISPAEGEFFCLMTRCLRLWRRVLRPSANCIFILADTCTRATGVHLPDMIIDLATESVGGYRVKCMHREDIPNIRRVRRDHRGSASETFLVLQRA